MTKAGVRAVRRSVTLPNKVITIPPRVMFWRPLRDILEGRDELIIELNQSNDWLDERLSGRVAGKFSTGQFLIALRTTLSVASIEVVKPLELSKLGAFVWAPPRLKHVIQTYK